MRGRDSVAAVCVLLREGLCAWEPKTSSGCCAPYLPDRGNHRRATAKPPKPVKMLWSAVRFIYLFIPPGGGNSQTVIVATQNWLWASDLHLLLPPVGNLRVEVPLRSGWTHQTSRIFEQAVRQSYSREGKACGTGCREADIRQRPQERPSRCSETCLLSAYRTYCAVTHVALTSNPAPSELKPVSTCVCVCLNIKGRDRLPYKNILQVQLNP